MHALIKIFAITFAIGFASCITDGESYNEAWSIENGSTLPTFSVVLSDGKEISNTDLADKHAVILFFNTDCSDCRRELPKIQDVYAQTCNDFTWIAIGREQDPEEAAQFWSQNSLTIPYSAQPNRNIYSLFASQGIPRIYIADDQIIVAQLDPDQLQGTAELIKTLKAIK